VVQHSPWQCQALQILPVLNKMPDTRLASVIRDAHTLQLLWHRCQHRLQDAKVLEQGTASWAEVFGARFIPGTGSAIQEQHAIALLCQQDADRRTSRASAYD
jgi:hypothetical protein